jgi:hypothetical protein
VVSAVNTDFSRYFLLCHILVSQFLAVIFLWLYYFYVLCSITLVLIRTVLKKGVNMHRITFSIIVNFDTNLVLDLLMRFSWS